MMINSACIKKPKKKEIKRTPKKKVEKELTVF